MGCRPDWRNMRLILQRLTMSSERKCRFPAAGRPKKGPARRTHRPDGARRTLACHRNAFKAKGLGAAWGRVLGLVVQPGLEFAPTHTDRFDMAAPDALSGALSEDPHIAFNTHSTDDQHGKVLPGPAKRHFAVLKVGLALTHAYRRALYALDDVSRWGEPSCSGHDLSDVVERLMVQNPGDRQKHYKGDSDALRVQRHFGYADRIRYILA